MITSNFWRNSEPSLSVLEQISALFTRNGESLQQVLDHMFGIVGKTKGHNGLCGLWTVLLPYREEAVYSFTVMTQVITSTSTFCLVL